MDIHIDKLGQLIRESSPLRYDADMGAVYIDFRLDEKSTDVVKHSKLEMAGSGDMVILDFSGDGTLIGIEII